MSIISAPICVSCQREFTVKENGVRVLETAGKDQEPYRVWAADLYECPSCHSEIISGFGNAPFVSKLDESFQRVIDINKHHETLYYNHECPR